MRASLGALTLAILSLTASQGLEAQQLREDSYRWFIAPQGGVLLFETQTQTSSAIPVVGAQALIIGKRGGLIVEYDEALGSEETSAFGDSDAPNGVRQVTFDRIRKYSATMMAYPLRSRLEPFIGAGFGIMHTVGTEVDATFTSPEEAAEVIDEAVDRGSTGFGSLVGGVQYRVSPRLVLYGQYQITTAPAAGKLLIGPTDTIGQIALVVRLAQVGQHPSALTHKLEQTPPAGLIFFVGTKMIRQLLDTAGQNGDLYFGGAGIGIMGDSP